MHPEKVPSAPKKTALGRIEERSGPWLHAWWDALAELKTGNGRMATADLNGDGAHSLLVLDDSRKLKVFADTRLSSTHQLFDASACLCTLTLAASKHRQRCAGVAVASGYSVYIYSKDMRPYLKYTLPPLNVCPAESHLWQKYKTDGDGKALLCALQSLRNSLMEGNTDTSVELTLRSSFILSLASESDRLRYCQTYRCAPLAAYSSVTCLAALCKKNVESGKTVLVAGTEHGDVLLIEIDADTQETKTTVLHMAKSGALQQVICSGQLGADYRLVALTRRRVLSAKNGRVLHKSTVDCEALPVCCALLPQSTAPLLALSCVNDVLYGYSQKGSKLWTLHLKRSERVIAMDSAKVESKALAVCGTNSGRVLLVDCDGAVVHSLSIGLSPISALCFGSYGRSEKALVVATDSGALCVKMWSRTFEMAELRPMRGGATMDDAKAHDRDFADSFGFGTVTDLELEQREKEKAEASEMHYAFQRQSLLMKLRVAKTHLRSLESSQRNDVNNLLLTGECLGLGPLFRVEVTVENTNEKELTDLRLFVAYNAHWYKCHRHKAVIGIPMLVPNTSYTYAVEVEVLKSGNSEPLQLTLLTFDNSRSLQRTLASSTVQMPMWDEAMV